MNISLRFFLLPLVLLPFFWDFYIFGFKIFDVLSFSLAIFSLIFIKKTDFKEVNKTNIIIFLCFFLFFNFIGLIINIDLKGFIGITMGMVYFYLLCLYFNKQDVKRYSFYVLIILLGSWFLQFATIILFDNPINYHAFVGDAPRIQNGMGYRTAGLFLEPTSHCAMMFIVISTRFIFQSFTKYEFIGILSMILSFSLYGVFASIILIGFWSFYKLRSAFLIYAVLFIFAIRFTFFFQNLDYATGELQIANLQERILSLSSDASVQARYSPENVFNRSLLEVLFGSGLTALGENHAYGSSGLGVLISGLGLIGFFLFLLLIINLYKRSIFLIVSSILVILMSSSYITYLVFWVWLAWMYVIVTPENIDEAAS